MYFLDTSYFTGDIFIPNLEETSIKNLEFYKNASKWEKEALELVLGKCLADELLENLEISGGDGEKKYILKETSEKFKWEYLINGRKYRQDDEYVSNHFDLSSCGCGCSGKKCEVHNWEGLVKTQNIILNGEEIYYKESLLAYYVYFMWCFETNTKTSGVGEVKLKAKNSKSVDNREKRISAFNTFWTWTRTCGIGGKTGLHIFLKEHSELFPNFQEICFENQNFYGI